MKNNNRPVMHNHKKLSFILLMTLAFAFATTLASFSSQEQSNQAHNHKPKYNDERWPIVDYDSPEPADPEKRAKRRAKNIRFNKQDLVPKPAANPDNGEVTLVTDWEVGFPALPLERSTVILIGKIQDAHAYLSEDRSGIYSEFSVKVERMLKNEISSSVVSSSEVIVERVGGRIRMPSGHIHQFGIGHQGMPKVDGRYVLFLSGNEAQGLKILTGYELKEGLIFPLDGVDPADGSGIPQFAEHKGADASIFLKKIEGLLTQSSLKP